jgi:hypothetical protein
MGWFFQSTQNFSQLLPAYPMIQKYGGPALINASLQAGQIFDKVLATIQTNISPQQRETLDRADRIIAQPESTY